MLYEIFPHKQAHQPAPSVASMHLQELMHSHVLPAEPLPTGRV